MHAGKRKLSYLFILPVGTDSAKITVLRGLVITVES